MAEWKDKADLNNKTSRENHALQFYYKYKDLLDDNGRKITQIKIAKNFNITAQRLGNIIKNPLSIGRTAGPLNRMPEIEELAIVHWIDQRARAPMHTTKDMIIEKTNEISKARSDYGFGHLNKRGPLSKYWYYGEALGA